MRRYKQVYGIPFALMMVEISYLMVFFLIPEVIYFIVDSDMTINEGLYIIVGFFLLFSLMFITIGVIINLVSKLFTKAKIEMYDNYLIYGKEIIYYHEIISVNYSNGEASRTKNTPHSVTFVYGNHKYLQIERPPLRMVNYLRKKVKKGVFRIDDLYTKLVKYPVIGLTIGIIFVLFIILF